MAWRAKPSIEGVLGLAHIVDENDRVVAYVSGNIQNPEKDMLAQQIAADHLDAREHATVLAALRYWAREGLISEGGEHEIASNAGTVEPLTKEEIGDLCGRLNWKGA